MKTYIVFFFFYFFCNVMRADLTSNLWETSYLLKYNGEGYIIPNPTICTDLLDEFADYAANFTKCSIKHARPIRLCTHCIDNYMDFHDKYEELLTTVVNGTSCKSLFISHDRLDAVLDFHDSILAIWDKGYCNACFDWSNKRPELSNDTKRFNKMFEETMECIVQNLNPAANNSNEVCEKCMLSYVELNKFYESLSSDAIGLDSVCMDIVDSMNATRSIWSKVLDCCKLRRTPEIVFLCCTVIIATLPLLFYVAVRFCGPIKDLPNVLKQSRFKQIILRSKREGRVN